MLKVLQSLMSGLMGAWWRMRSLVLLQVQGFLPVVQVVFGRNGLG